jgi:class 3 adenylate cyclase
MSGEMEGLSASALADLSGTTAEEVQRLVDLGILIADSAGMFGASDVQKVRLLEACERAGLPVRGIAAAVREGRLSLNFLEAAPYRRWAMRSTRTYRQVSQDTGIPLDALGSVLESMGFARMAPDEAIREDELEHIVPMLQLAHSMGNLDQGLMRIGRAWAEGMRLAATAENQDYTARYGRLLEAGVDLWAAKEQAARLATELLPLVDRAVMTCYRRQQELVWTESLVEDIENEMDAAGAVGRSERVPAMCFLDLVGFTRLTDERGDQAAAELAGALTVLVDGSAREHNGLPVKWLGDGVMIYFREPAAAVLGALEMVEGLSAAKLPPGHLGVAAGPVVGQGGDYFGRTVNLAARIAAHAGPGQVLVSDSVVKLGSPEGVVFLEAGEVQLKGFARPVMLFEACRA